MATWISLLRAVNLGSHNKVSMPLLREALEAAGFNDVRTYVQSGNVITDSRHRSAKSVAGAVHDVVADAFGLDIVVIVRTPKQMADVVAANPYPEAARKRPKALSVVLLAGDPESGAKAALADAFGDQCRLVGQTLYADYRDGVHGSKMTPDRFQRLCGVAGTARNWRTAQALVDMTS